VPSNDAELGLPAVVLFSEPVALPTESAKVELPAVSLKLYLWVIVWAEAHQALKHRSASNPSFHWVGM
jgi:hypothetical protein